ncbi:hypothetical protein [Effusibacillus pohliae]|uniref:hypothetical protein n=1 Tax=Effusibacillus pohliae TaxID=232270 RepID=UPI00037E907D|nr:hypothetical protein [Effusibacillus pohliae]
MQKRNKALSIDKRMPEQLAQKQMEEMDEELTHLSGVPGPHDTPGLPENKKSTADLFSAFPNRHKRL